MTSLEGSDSIGVPKSFKSCFIACSPDEALRLVATVFDGEFSFGAHATVTQTATGVSIVPDDPSNVSDDFILMLENGKFLSPPKYEEL